MRFIRSLFLTNRFFYVMACIIAITLLGFAFPVLLAVAKAVGVLFIVVCVIDTLALYNRAAVVEVQREIPSLLSLGDDNTIHLSLLNKSRIAFWVEIIDELPEQFQSRKFSIGLRLAPGVPVEQTYQLRPLTRGEYAFGSVHLFLTTGLGIVRRRLTGVKDTVVPVYPSIIQMKKYELKTFARTATEYGVKKVRRIGHSYEFDHIKQYTRGNDYRSINWKATGRRAQLMVNQYEDEKSQQVYCIIDKGRLMKMPFDGLTLLDYAINSAIVMSNVCLQKQAV